MFAFEKNQKEEAAIQNLLAISCQNEEKDIFVSSNDNLVNKKKLTKDSANQAYQLGPWGSADTCNNKVTGNARNTSTTNETKKENNNKSTKPRDNSFTKVNMRRSKNGNKINNTLYDEKFRFCHFEDMREFITQYRESVTFLTMLDYRNGLMKTPPVSGGLCKSCESSFDVIRHCQCSSGNSPTSSSVCYVDAPEHMKNHHLLSTIGYLGRRISDDQNTSKCKSEVCKQQNKKLRKLSPGGGKLWVSGSLKKRASPPIGNNKTCKNKGCKSKVRYCSTVEELEKENVFSFIKMYTLLQ